MKINADFDSGNIIVRDTVLSDSKSDTPNKIALEIRKDNKADHLQWFYFQMAGKKNEKYELCLTNASNSSFACWKKPDGPFSYQLFPYQAVASYDGKEWFRVATEFDGKQLIIRITLEQENVFVAFFAPYPYARHQQLMASAVQSPRCLATVIGKSTEGRDLTLLTIGEPDPQKIHCWFIARQHPGEPVSEWFMEGMINRLLGKNDKIVEALLEKAVFYLVPNMNPDGTIRGNLRTNAEGVDLNRAWQAPDKNKCPEVYYVRAKMHEVGVDFFMDVHGEEEIPYVFLENRQGCPTLNPFIEAVEMEFIKLFMATNHHVQDTHHYEPSYKPGEADLRLANTYVSETFDCTSLLLEMPTKDDANHPDSVRGWSPQSSVKLGEAVLEPLHGILPKLTCQHVRLDSKDQKASANDAKKKSSASKESKSASIDRKSASISVGVLTKVGVFSNKSSSSAETPLLSNAQKSTADEGGCCTAFFSALRRCFP